MPKIKADRVVVLKYRTKFTHPWGARGDVVALVGDEIVRFENICLCGWCCRTCKLQGEVLQAAYEAELASDRLGELTNVSRAWWRYLRGTRGKWVIILRDGEKIIGYVKEG